MINLPFVFQISDSLCETIRHLSFTFGISIYLIFLRTLRNLTKDPVMTTPILDPSTRDVSFIGSLLKLNSIGSNFKAHQFFKHPSGLGHVPKRLSGFTNGSVTAPATKFTAPAAAATTLQENCANSNGQSVPSSPTSATTSSSSKASTPKTPLTQKSPEKMKNPFRGHVAGSGEKNVSRKVSGPVKSPLSSPMVGERERQQAIVDPVSLRSQSRCRYCWNPEPGLDAELRANMKTNLVSNLYYVPPPPTLVEYRNRELTTQEMVCCEKITDELIDLTQSTISMVQLLKRELHH